MAHPNAKRELLRTKLQWLKFEMDLHTITNRTGNCINNKFSIDNRA